MRNGLLAPVCAALLTLVWTPHALSQKASGLPPMEEEARRLRDEQQQKVRRENEEKRREEELKEQQQERELQQRRQSEVQQKQPLAAERRLARQQHALQAQQQMLARQQDKLERQRQQERQLQQHVMQQAEDDALGADRQQALLDTKRKNAGQARLRVEQARRDGRDDDSKNPGQRGASASANQPDQGRMDKRVEKNRAYTRSRRE